MSEHLWYYELLDEAHGPVSTDEIQQMVADGQLTDDDRIRTESSEEWITVNDLQTLVESVASGEDEWEEVTDLDDLNFTFEDSSAGVSRANESAADIDDRHSGLDIDSFQLVGDPEQARHSAFDSVAGKSADNAWMVQSLGQILGPMAMLELVGMAETGALSGSDGIRQQHQDEWVPADSISEVAQALSRAAAGLPSPPTQDTEAQNLSAASDRKMSRSADRSSPGKKDKPSAKSATGRKRRRKKKRSKKDQLLAEIFSDVFAEDGKVRDLSERPDLSKPVAPARALGTPPDVPSVNTPPAGGFNASDSAAPASPGMAAAGLSGYPSASPGMLGGPAAAASRPAFVPPAKKKKRGGGGGAGLSMPEPPVLAAIGGVLLVLLIGTGGYLGWFTIPGFGVDPTTLFADFEKEFSVIVSKEIPKDEWEAFRAKFLTGARQVARKFTPTAGRDPEAAKMLNKALLIVRLLEIPQSKIETREKSWTKYQELK